MDTATTVTINKWQSRIEQRRTDPRSAPWAVVNYVEGLMLCNKVPFEDLAPFLTADELQAIQNKASERARQQAEAHARYEAERLQRQEEWRKLEQRIAAFRSEHPFPIPAITLADVENLNKSPVFPCSSADIENLNKSNEKALFDILHRYSIIQLVWQADILRYHWDDFEGFEDSYIRSITLGDDIELDDLGDALFPNFDQSDQPDGNIAEALSEAINNIAETRAYEMANNCKINDPLSVTFDVPSVPSPLMQKSRRLLVLVTV
jgi:hypothetical protein